MSLEFVKGDIFASGCRAIVVPVNCVGVMGAGLAKTANDRYPKACEWYFSACRQLLLRPGGILSSYCELPAGPGWLLFAATKRDWKHTARLWWVEQCLDGLGSMVSTVRIPSIAVPALGCGLGLLDWDDVRPAMEVILGRYPDVDWRIYEPLGL